MKLIFQLLYFEQDANAGYGLALQVYVVLSGALQSSFPSFILLLVLFIVIVLIYMHHSIGKLRKKNTFNLSDVDVVFGFLLLYDIPLV